MESFQCNLQNNSLCVSWLQDRVRQGIGCVCDQVGCVWWEIRRSIQEMYCLDSYRCKGRACNSSWLGEIELYFFSHYWKILGVLGLRYGWVQMLSVIRTVSVSLDLGSAFLLLAAFWGKFSKGKPLGNSDSYSTSLSNARFPVVRPKSYAKSYLESCTKVLNSMTRRMNMQIVYLWSHVHLWSHGSGQQLMVWTCLLEGMVSQKKVEVCK